jgi:chemotaxis signal transduction protein
MLYHAIVRISTSTNRYATSIRNASLHVVTLRGRLGLQKPQRANSHTGVIVGLYTDTRTHIIFSTLPQVRHLTAPKLAPVPTLPQTVSLHRHGCLEHGNRAVGGNVV